MKTNFKQIKFRNYSAGTYLIFLLSILFGYYLIVKFQINVSEVVEKFFDAFN